MKKAYWSSNLLHGTLGCKQKLSPGTSQGPVKGLIDKVLHTVDAGLGIYAHRVPAYLWHWSEYAHDSNIPMVPAHL